MKSLILFICGFIFISTCFQLKSQTVETIEIRPGPENGYDAEIRTDINHPIWNDDDFIANDWTVGGAEFSQRSLIKFDLSSIPPGAIITSARLSLFCNTTSGHHQLHSGNNSSYLLKITSDWDQYQVVWNNQPTTSMEGAIVLPKSEYQKQDYTNIDVTAMVDDFYLNSHKNFGFMIRLVEEELYQALVFASSNHLDSAKRPLLVIKYILCEAPDANFTYNHSENNNSNVSFIVNENNSTNYYWDFGNGNFSNLSQPVFAFQDPGKYNVCLTASNNCDTITICDTVIVCDRMDAFFNFEIDGSSVSFTPFTEIGDAQYLWDFGDGFLSTIINPVHEYNNQENYEVCLAVSNVCNDVLFCDTVRIIEVSSNENNILDEVIVFPNPSDGVVKIRLITDNNSIRGINVIGVTGKLIKEISHLNLLKNEDFQIDLSVFSQGIYDLLILTEKGNIHRKITIVCN